MAYQGVMLSMPVCHLGGFFGGFGLPIFLYCRIAITVEADADGEFGREGCHAASKCWA